MNTYYVRYVHDRGQPYQVLADSRWSAALQFHNIPARPGETGGPVAVSVWTEAEWRAGDGGYGYEYDVLDIEDAQARQAAAIRRQAKQKAGA